MFCHSQTIGGNPINKHILNNLMKNLTLLLLLSLSLALTAEAQTAKKNMAYKAKYYDLRIIRYMPAAPKEQQSNPYAFADSAKSNRPVKKKKTN